MNFKDKSVLIIGDSLSDGSHTPGAYLMDHMVKGGASTVIIDAKRGRSTNSFFRFEKGQERLEGYRKMNWDLVIIFLGTNSTNTKAQWRELATWPEPTKVVCFSPPSLTGEYAKQVAEDHVVARQKRYFPRWVDLTSLDQGAQRSPDNVHFTRKGAATLARTLYDLLSTQKVVQKAPEIFGLSSVFTMFPLLWVIDRRNRLRE